MNIVDKETSDKIVADAVREWWRTHYFGSVVVFFKQKHEHDDEYEPTHIIASQAAWGDSETVEFDWDFCEGETDVQDIQIFDLHYVLGEFALTHLGGTSE